MFLEFADERFRPARIDQSEGLLERDLTVDYESLGTEPRVSHGMVDASNDSSSGTPFANVSSPFFLLSSLLSPPETSFFSPGNQPKRNKRSSNETST